MIKTKVQDLINALEKQLEEFSKEHNVMIKVKGCSYNEFEIIPKIIITPIIEGKTDDDTLREKFEAAAIRSFDIDKDWYGKELNLGDGRVVKILEIDSKKRKYPIIAHEIGSHKQYKLSIAQVQKLVA